MVLTADEEQKEKIGTDTKKWDKYVRLSTVTLDDLKFPPSYQERTFHKMGSSVSAETYPDHQV